MARYTMFFVLASVAGILLQTLAGCSSDGGGGGSDAVAAVDTAVDAIETTVDAATTDEGGAADGDIAELNDVCPGPLDGPENTLSACSDGYDNDGDKYIDCQDFECMKSSNPAIVAYCKNDPKVVECGGLEEKDTVDLDVGTPGCTGLCALLSDQAKEWSSPTTYLKCLPADTCPADRPNLFKLEGDNGCASCFDACWAKWIPLINNEPFFEVGDYCTSNCDPVVKVYGLGQKMNDEMCSYDTGLTKAWEQEKYLSNPRLVIGTMQPMSLMECGANGLKAKIEYYDEINKTADKLEAMIQKDPSNQQLIIKVDGWYDGILSWDVVYAHL